MVISPDGGVPRRVILCNDATHAGLKLSPFAHKRSYLRERCMALQARAIYDSVGDAFRAGSFVGG